MPGTAGVGAPWIGRIFAANLAVLARRFEVFTGFHATFHLSNERSWKSARFDDYVRHNREQGRLILGLLQQKYGVFPSGSYPGRFLQFLHREDQDGTGNTESGRARQR